jgi:hypothetical protein
MRMSVNVLVARAAARLFHGNRMEPAVPHAFLRHDGFRELQNLRRGATEDHGFDAVVATGRPSKGTCGSRLRRYVAGPQLRISHAHPK